MSKPTKILLISLTLVIMVPFITLLALSKLHHRVVHEELVEIIKNELEGKVEFEDFKFSYLRSFPKVHAEFINMTIHDSNGGVSKIGDLDVFLDFSDIMQRKVLIDKLVVSDAFFMSVIDSLGSKPRIFSGWKKSKENGGNILLVESHDVEILNSRVFIDNKVKGNKLMASISSGLFNLTVADSAVLISGNVSASLDTLISNHNLLLKNQPAAMRDVVFRIDNKTGVKELEEGLIIAHTLELFPKIRFEPAENGQLVDLHITSKGNFDTFLELVDFHFDFDLEQVNPDATFAISYNQKGLVNPFLRPYSEFDFQIINAEFAGSKLPYPVKKFYFQGNLNNGQDHSPESSVLVIDTIHAEVSDSYINGRFSISNLKDPVVDAHFRSNLNLSHLVKPNENVVVSGNVEADLIIDGKISELKKIHLEEKQHARGVIKVDDLNILLKKSGYNLNLKEGSSILNNHIFEVTTLAGAFNESAFHIEGVFDNLDQFLSDENKGLEGQVDLKFGRLDLERFDQEQTDNSLDAKSVSVKLPSMSLSLNAAGDQIVGDFGEINNVQIQSRIQTSEINIDQLKFQYQEGEVNASGDIFLSGNTVDSVIADISGSFDHLNYPLTRDTLQVERKSSGLSLPTFIFADIKLDVNEGEIFSVPLKNLNIAAQISGNQANIPNLYFDAFGGYAKLAGQVRFDEEEIKGIKVKSEVNFDYLDLGQYVTIETKADEDTIDVALADLPGNMDIQFDGFIRELVYKDQNITNVHSAIDIADNEINIKDFSASLPFGSFDMNIKLDGIRNSTTAYLGSIDLQIDTLYLSRFLNSEALGLPNRNTGNNKKSEQRFQKVFVPNSRLEVSTKADRIYYQNGSVDALDFELVYSSDKIDLKKLNFYFANGRISTFGHILNDNTAEYDAYINSTVDSIDIRKVFLAFNSFDQKVFSAQNSSGSLSWNSQLYLQLDQSFFPISNDNLWKFEISVHNGEFKKIEPIEEALFFVGHKAKDDLIVSELDINAYIYENNVIFKDVFMNDNIADLDLFGKIDLQDSLIDIGVEISLTDLLFRSKKERIAETKEGEDHLESDMKLFLEMYGPLAKHKLKMSSGRKFRRSRNALDEMIDQAESSLKAKSRID